MAAAAVAAGATSHRFQRTSRRSLESGTRPERQSKGLPGHNVPGSSQPEWLQITISIQQRAATGCQLIALLPQPCEASLLLAL
mmetsp:Transcript_133211/g.344724  ORF Transcript_133211/g.344724 Transcript_133211/m.344724 type:complete len:83 (+) Transcript_133211:1580-1828(+)